MMNEDKYLNLTDVEWRLMHAIWSLGEPTLGQIIKDVADIGWSKQSLISFLKRMEAKGVVRRDASQRPSKYRALVKRDEAIRQETDAVINKVYGGDPLLMVTSAVNSGKMNEDDIKHLIDLLKRGDGDK